MANITLNIDIPDLSQISSHGFFSTFYTYLARHKAETESKIIKILEDYARDGHRQSGGKHYKKQTGRLAKSTHATADLTNEIRLYVDKTQLDYAEWIVNGHRRGKGGNIVKWNNGHGDPFIDEAMNAKYADIQAIIIDFYNKAILEFNSRG